MCKTSRLIALQEELISSWLEIRSLERTLETVRQEKDELSWQLTKTEAERDLLKLDLANLRFEIELAREKLS